MAIDFPNSPSVNDEFTAGGTTWKWNGTVWNTVTTQVATGPTGPQGTAGADGVDGDPGATGPSGVISVSAPITNSGTSTSAQLGLAALTNTNIASNAAIASDKITLSVGSSTNGGNGVGFRGIPSSSVSGGSTSQYFIEYDDAGRVIWSTGGRTLVINKGDHPIGTTFVFATGTGTTISISTNIGETFILAGSGVKTSLQLAPFGMATGIKVATSTWLFSGNGLT